MTERFTLIEKIGRGGMGVVWKARDEQSGQIVALKLLHSVFADDPDYVTRFERELELARRIHSPNVVGVLGYGVREGTPYLALEYVDGLSLRERLAAQGPYGWPDARNLLIQITAGLADAHAAGVIHRDLKPSNILVGSDGVAKIADFGIARGVDLTRVTGTSTMLGTPAYLPPEGPRNERSDLYSLGVMAYELLTGAPPFDGTTYAEVLMAHVRKRPDLAKLPAEARPIVGRLLAKEPGQRPGSAKELLAALPGAAHAAEAPLMAAPVPHGRGSMPLARGTGQTEGLSAPPSRPVPPGSASGRSSIPRRRVGLALGGALAMTLALIMAVSLPGLFPRGSSNPTPIGHATPTPIGHATPTQMAAATLTATPTSTGEGLPGPSGEYSAVSVGYLFTCAIKTDATLACWGRVDQDFGQATPPSGTFTAVSAASFSACAIKTDATLACWGSKDHGWATPPSGTYVALDVGGHRSCAIRTDGTIVCWGIGYVGDIEAPSSGKYTVVTSGDMHSCGIKTDGTLACWGQNDYGKAAPPSGTYLAVSAGDDHTCVVKTDGALACWGGNDFGQATPPAGTYAAVSAGGHHTCAIKTDGTLACWGANMFSQSTPPSGAFTAVSAGSAYTWAIRETDGTLVCWGESGSCQATDSATPSPTESATPSPTPTPTPTSTPAPTARPPKPGPPTDPHDTWTSVTCAQPADGITCVKWDMTWSHSGVPATGFRIYGAKCLETRWDGGVSVGYPGKLSSVGSLPASARSFSYSFTWKDAVPGAPEDKWCGFAVSAYNREGESSIVKFPSGNW